MRVEMLKRGLPRQYFGSCIMRCQLSRQFESLQRRGAPMDGFGLQINAEVRVRALAGIFALCWENTLHSRHASHGACATLGGYMSIRAYC